MSKHSLEGYWYCDARPDGSYVASQFNSDKNILNGNEINGKQLIWTVLGPNGKFAGSSQINNHAWEWNNNWNDKGINEGLHAVIYQANGELLVVRETSEAPTGALGWRYVDDDGNLVSAVDSINPDAKIAKQYGIKDLWEYTYHEGIAVGQGQNGIYVVIGNKRARLDTLVEEHPNCRYPNFHKEGNKISISWYFFRNPTSYKACFLWLTEEELRALLPDEEPVPIEDIMIPSFERPMWQAPFFSHHSRYGDTSIEKHVGNSIWVPASEIERVKSLGQPLIVHPDTEIPDWAYNTIIAYWVSGATVSELIDEVIDCLTLSEKPIIAYLDNRDWPEQNPFYSSLGSDRIWPSIQAYRAPNESLVDFKYEMDEVITRVNSYKVPMGLTTRFDDFNGSGSISKTLECMPFYEEWLRLWNFVVHMPFSDRRGNAISNNESLWSWARAFQFAIPSSRPNRFDYWRPDNSEIEDILKNKLNQSRAAIVLEPYLREDILNKYENGDTGGDEEPDINEPLLRQVLEQAWDKHGGAPGGGNPKRGIILNEAAYNYNREVGSENVGLSRKESGSYVLQPDTDEKIAHDIIQVKPPEGKIFSTMYDCFDDNGVQLGEADQHNNPDRIWIAPVKP